MGVMSQAGPGWATVREHEKKRKEKKRKEKSHSLRCQTRSGLASENLNRGMEHVFIDDAFASFPFCLMRGEMGFSKQGQAQQLSSHKPQATSCKQAGAVIVSPPHTPQHPTRPIALLRVCWPPALIYPHTSLASLPFPVQPGDQHFSRQCCLPPPPPPPPLAAPSRCCFHLLPPPVSPLRSPSRPCPPCPPSPAWPARRYPPWARRRSWPRPSS